MAQNIASTLPTEAKSAAAVALAERLLRKYAPPAPVTPAGAEVEHLEGCLCEGEDAPGTSPAIMWDERTTVRGALEIACLAELETRLNSSGRTVLRYRKERWNAAGQHIGPELAIRSCEVAMAWLLANNVREHLDKVVAS